MNNDMIREIFFILPTYNESKSIFDLLKNIDRVRLQIKSNITCLIVNDASSDDTNSWIKKSNEDFNNIRIIEIKHKTNLGLNNALN